MSEAVQTLKTIGRLQLAIIDFKDAGDVLPMHAHTEDNSHITIVREGRIRAHGPGWEKILEPGAMIVFKPGQQHELVALTAGARVTNIVY